MTAMSNRADAQRTSAEDDYALVAACRKGDVDAFEALVEKYQKKTFNVAFRMLGDYEDACEVVQETFLSAYRAIKKFRGDAAFATWLYGICINHAKNRIKQTRSRTHHEGPSLDEVTVTEDGPIAFEPASTDPLASEQLEKKELQEKVQECIGALEDGYREVLVLRDIQGFSYEEISDILKIPDGTVKSRLYRARDALKNSLKNIVGDL